MLEETQPESQKRILAAEVTVPTGESARSYGFGQFHCEENAASGPW